MKQFFTLLFTLALGVSRIIAQCTPPDTLGLWLAHKLPEGVEGQLSLDVVDADTIWALETQIKARWYRSTDGGCTWQSGAIPQLETQQRFSISAFSASVACVVAYDNQARAGHIYRTTDGGKNWSDPMPAGAFSAPTGFANFVYFFNKNDGVACGDATDGYFEIYTTADGGASWSRVPVQNIPTPTDEAAFLVSQFSAAGDTIWVPSFSGRVYRSTDKGAHWTYAEPFSPVAFADGNQFSIAFRDALHGIYYWSLTNTIWRTNDGGVTWSAAPLASVYPFLLTAIPGTGIYFSDYYYSTDDAESWVLYADGPFPMARDFINRKTGWGFGYTWAGKATLYQWRALKTFGSVSLPTMAATTLRQASAFRQETNILNLSEMPTSATTEWTVTRDGIPVLAKSKSTEVAAGKNAGSAQEFLPEIIGFYAIETKTTVSNSAVPVLNKKARLVVTDTLISKGDLNGQKLFSSLGTARIGTQLDLIQKDSLSGLSVWYQGGEPGGSANCSIRFAVRGFLDSSNAPTVLLYQSPVRALTAADTGTWVFHALAKPLVLEAGKYVLSVQVSNTQGKPRYFGYSLDQSDFSVWFLPTGSLSWQHYIDPYACLVFRAHFRPSGVTATKTPGDLRLSLEFFPNPATDIVQLRNAPIGTRLEAQVSNTEGRTVFSGEISGKGYAIDLSNQPSGVYFIRTFDGERWGVSRVVKR